MPNLERIGMREFFKDLMFMLVILTVLEFVVLAVISIM